MRLLLLALLLPWLGAADLVWTPEQLKQIKAALAHTERKGERFACTVNNYAVETEIDAEFTAKAAVYMDGLRGDLIRLFSLAGKSQHLGATTVLITANRESYQAAVPNAGSGRGFFRHAYKKGVWTEFALYTFVKVEAERSFERFYHPILQHEGTHQVLQEFAGMRHIPELLNEGMASLIQSWDLGKSQEDNFKQRKSSYLAKLKGGLDATKLTPLSELYDAQPWNVDNFGDRSNTRYFQAEMFIEYMMVAPNRLKLLGNLLDQELKGQAKLAEVSKLLGEVQADYVKYLLATTPRR